MSKEDKLKKVNEMIASGEALVAKKGPRAAEIEATLPKLKALKTELESSK